MRLTSTFLACLMAASPATVLFAKDKPLTTTIYAISDDGIGEPIGSISFKNSKAGLVLMTSLSDLPVGDHGIHIHEKADCSPMTKDGKSVAGLSAGGHFDPAKAGKHLGPQADGHKGDLPFLTVSAKGIAHEKLLAPHLTLADIEGHALIIHAGGDNYSDEPKPLGGGGARIACGVIQ